MRKSVSGKKGSLKRSIPEKQVAVIEEVADNIYSIKFVLQSLGYSVLSVSVKDNSYVDSLQEFRPDLIIIDMMIPGGEAYPVIRGIRKRKSLQKIPILAITADAMEGKEEDIYAAGGRDVLPKPYTVGDLQQKLKKWLTN